MISLVERPKGRRAAIGMMYEKTNISEQISRDIESFSYSDVAASKSDSVSITIRASEDKWKGEWMPDKGAKLYPSIIVYDWNIGGVVNGVRPYSAECGAFMVEETSFSASPDKLSISGVAKPNDTSFSARRRTFTWKETSIKNIAKKIGERYGLQVKFDAEDQQVDAKEQDATDSAFLQDLCETYALVIKVYAQQLWIYDREKYKQKSAVWTAYKEMPKNNRTAICVESGSFSWSTSTTGTYTGGIYTYTNKKKGYQHLRHGWYRGTATETHRKSEQRSRRKGQTKSGDTECEPRFYVVQLYDHRLPGGSVGPVHQHFRFWLEDRRKIFCR